MNNNTQKEFDGSFYDEDYYQRGRQTGKGWLENYRFIPRRSFKEAFSFIDTLNLDENSYVLDFGCAYGFIVKCLRMLEIKADGCDISEHAISKAPEGCWNCSTEESWKEHENFGYTNIIVKDVFEHLTPEQLYKTLGKMSKIAPKIMTVIPMGDNGVYRIPEYHTEVSHLIAENESWWRNAFWKAGWRVLKETNYVPGLKDTWAHVKDGNYVFVLEKYR